MSPLPAEQADLERRFGGLRRLYGEAGYARLRAARVAVVGVGGVGSWAVEALARCGVHTLVMLDLDHIAESNVNRQIQALGATLGAAKVRALAQRVADIHPGCRLWPVEAFVEAGTWPGLLPEPVDVVIDACDDPRAKRELAVWALQTRQALVISGAAGGKRQPQQVACADLAAVTHDPLLASLRQRLRRDHGAARQGPIGLRCVYSTEPVTRAADCEAPESPQAGLNCHGWGSSVMVTAAFGLACAAEAVRLLQAPHASAAS